MGTWGKKNDQQILTCVKKIMQIYVMMSLSGPEAIWVAIAKT